MLRQSLLRWLILCGLVFLQSCATQRSTSRTPGAGGALVPLARPRLSAAQEALVNVSCYGGMPAETNSAWMPTELIFRRGYVLEHSSLGKVPLWVCERVEVSQLGGREVRSNKFRADPDLKGPKAYPSDYAQSGYDRGHQAPAGNQTTDQALKEQTFYMSNIAPQVPSLNRGAWRALEEKSRRWVRRYGLAYEWTGPILCDQAAGILESAELPCEIGKIGKSGIVIPRFFYKILLVEDASVWKAIAFVLPNAAIRSPYHLEGFITSIDQIERRTGIQFMPQADRKVQAATKYGVSKMWSD